MIQIASPIMPISITGAEFFLLIVTVGFAAAMAWMTYRLVNPKETQFVPKLKSE